MNLKVEGEKNAGPTIDIKNLSSPKNIENAVEYEYLRHIEMLSKDEIPKPETRHYNENTNKTEMIRCKAEEPDYRYF